MSEEPKNYPDYIRSVYKNNNFMEDYLKVSIDEIHCGGATVSVFIEEEKHANHRHIVHGGVFAALADSVLGVTGASVGAVVVTTNFTMNFIRNVPFGHRVFVKSKIQHHGRSTMVITAEMIDDEDHLMGTIMTTMMIVGTFEGVPREW